MNERILTINDVAQYLKVSRVTVWKMVNDGRLKAFNIGRSWRIEEKELERYIQENANTGTD